jgi:preprotein translocase subunit SecB
MYQPPTTAAEVIALDPQEIHVEVKTLLHKDDPSKTLCELLVQSHPGAARCPYDFNAIITGFFKTETSSEKDRHNLVTQAEPSLLYSVAREVLLSQTERGPFPGVLLPVVTFSDSAPTAKTLSQSPVGASR